MVVIQRTLPSLLSLSSATIRSQQDGFGQKPLMGWNPYNAAGCTINETYATTMLDSFVSLKFPEAGYTHYSIDCGWQNYERNTTTNGLTYETGKWPNGMKAFGDLVKSKNLSFGLYTDVGVQSCDTVVPSQRPGSLGYEEVDAKALSDFGADYVKIDNCYVERNNNAPKAPRTDFVSRYSKFTNALKSNNIPGSLICQWGVPYQLPDGTLQAPGEWAPLVGQQYRLSDDIARGWNNVERIMNQAIYVADLDLTGPGKFADADLLEVGNPGMTVDEQASHFAFWAMFKSPLFVSTDLTKLTQASKDILFNKNLLAAHQDNLGKPISLVQRWTNDRDLFSGPLENGDQAVLAIEKGNQAKKLTIDFAQLGIAKATVLDMWTNKVYKTQSFFSADVKAHGSIALRLSQIEKLSPSCQKYDKYNIGNGSGTNVSSSTPITVTGIKTSKSASTVLFDYSNSEIQYLGSNIPNVRGASVSVNGGPAQVVSFPLSGYRWNEPKRNFKVDLTGFDTAKSNTITITPATSISPEAPEFFSVSVEA